MEREPCSAGSFPQHRVLGLGRIGFNTRFKLFEDGSHGVLDVGALLGVEADLGPAPTLDRGEELSETIYGGVRVAGVQATRVGR
jgi:hypothetical protein